MTDRPTARYATPDDMARRAGQARRLARLAERLAERAEHLAADLDDLAWQVKPIGSARLADLARQADALADADQDTGDALALVTDALRADRRADAAAAEHDRAARAHAALVAWPAARWTGQTAADQADDLTAAADALTAERARRRADLLTAGMADLAALALAAADQVAADLALTADQADALRALVTDQ